MSNIKINDFPTRKQYTYAGGTPEFVLDFPFFENTDIFVYVSNPADNGTQEDPQNLVTMGVDYTITGAGLPYGGVVTFDPGYNLTVGYTVTVVGRMPIDRTSILETTSAITRAQYNEDLNRIVCMIQQINTIIEQTMPKYDRSEFINTDRTLPNTPFSYVNLPWLPAGYCWAGNSEETGLTIFQLSAGGGVGFVTADHVGMRPSIALWTGTDFVLTDSNINIDGNNFVPVTAGQTIGVDNAAAAWGLPAHGTAARPAVPDNGDIYYDTDLAGVYVYYAGAWHLIATGAESSVVQDTITQANDFQPKEIVRFNKDTLLYERAKATSQEEAEVIGIVTSATAAVFTIQFIGKVTIPLAGWVPGRCYFLSSVTAGLLTLTEPTTNGLVSKPLLIATSATTGVFFNWRGIVLTDASDINQGEEVIIVTINQPGHGFVVLDALYTDTPEHYAKAFNDGTYHQADVIGIVKEVIDVDNFVMQVIGRNTTMPLGVLPGGGNLVANTSYFLNNQANAGKLTAVEPVTVGHFSRLVLTTTSSTSGWIKDTDPVEVKSSGGGSMVIVDSHVINNEDTITFSGVIDGTYGIMQFAGVDLVFADTCYLVMQLECNGVFINADQYRNATMSPSLADVAPGVLGQYGLLLAGANAGVPQQIKGNTSGIFNTYNKTSFTVDALGPFTQPKDHIFRSYCEFIPMGASYGVPMGVSGAIQFPYFSTPLRSENITGVRFVCINGAGAPSNIVSGTITIYGTQLTP